MWDTEIYSVLCSNTGEDPGFSFRGGGGTKDYARARTSWTLNREVSGSNLLTVVPLARHFTLIAKSLENDLKPLVPRLDAYKQLAFLVAR